MKEFGSDFHLIIEYQTNRNQLREVYHNSMLLADGRQCITALIRQECWQRIWVPEYFCYEVIQTIKSQTGIDVAYYVDYPLLDDQMTVRALPFQKNDVLLRVNYFGMRQFRSDDSIPVPVIEDHTHDLLGEWALNSDADWCVASLRKSLPLPEGGLLWSPKGHQLPLGLTDTAENERTAKARWHAMQMKRDYLIGLPTEKKVFRKKLVDTEEWFEISTISLIDKRSQSYIDKFDINKWHNKKRQNWRLLQSLVSDKVQIVQPEGDSCTMFSLIVLTESQKQREIIRHRLIENAVYPAILWQVPKETNMNVQDFSRRMLSIHCDGRYVENDIRIMAHIINEAIES